MFSIYEFNYRNIAVCFCFLFLGINSRLVSANDLKTSIPKDLEVYRSHSKESDSQPIVLQNTNKTQAIIIEETLLGDPFEFEKEPKFPLRLAPLQKAEWRIRFSASSCPENKEESDSNSPITQTLLIKAHLEKSDISEKVNIPLLALCKQGADIQCDSNNDSPLLFGQQISQKSGSSFSIKCTNEGDETGTIEANIKNPEDFNDQSSVFSISPQTLSLKPGQKGDFSVQMQVPNKQTEENLYRGSLELKTSLEENSINLIGLYTKQSLIQIRGFSKDVTSLNQVTFPRISFEKRSFQNPRLTFSLLGADNRTRENLKVSVKTQGIPESWFDAEISKNSWKSGDPLPEITITFSPEAKAKPQKIQAVLKIQAEAVGKVGKQTEELEIPITAHILEDSSLLTQSNNSNKLDENSSDTPHSKEVYRDEKPPEHEEKPSRFALSADAGVGVITSPLFQPGISPQGLRPYYSASSNVNQAIASTHVGGSIKLLTGCSKNGLINDYFFNRSYCWNLLVNVDVGGGYLSNYKSPFFEIKAGFELQSLFGQFHLAGLSFKIASGYANVRTLSPQVTSNTLATDYVRDTTHAGTLSVGPSFILNLDRFTHTKGFQMYIDTLYTVLYFEDQQIDFKTKKTSLYTSNESGFLTSIGFRRWF